MASSAFPPLSLAARTFTPDQLHHLHLTTLMTSFLGIAGAFSTLLAYVTFPRFRHHVIARLVVVVAVGDFVSVAAQGLGKYGPELGPTSGLCVTQAVLQLFGELWTIGLVACVAVQLLLVMYCSTYRRVVDGVRRLDYLYIPATFVFAAAVSLAALVPRNPSDPREYLVYGDGYLWCFIPPTVARFYWLLFAPLATTVALAITAIVAVQMTQRRRERRRLHNDAHLRITSYTLAPLPRDPSKIRAMLNTISMYLLVFTLTWIPIAAVHLAKLSTPVDSHTPTVMSPSGHPPNLYVRTLVMAIFLPLRGFGNALVAFYIASRGMREQRGKRGSMNDGSGRAVPTTIMYRVDTETSDASTAPAAAMAGYQQRFPPRYLHYTVDTTPFGTNHTTPITPRFDDELRF